MLTNEERRARAYAATSKWAKAHPERTRAACRKWAKTNPEKKAASERNCALKRKYGITQKDWNVMFDRQGRRCAICRAGSPGNRYGWNTDHDPVTGVVRGILCHGCNLMVHKYALPSVLIAAAEYVQRAGKGQHMYDGLTEGTGPCQWSWPPRV